MKVLLANWPAVVATLCYVVQSGLMWTQGKPAFVGMWAAYAVANCCIIWAGWQA
jgi:hypothetical protein